VDSYAAASTVARRGDSIRYSRLVPTAVSAIPSPDRADDVTLITLVAGGDQDAFRVLYERHGALVYAIARRVVADPHAQEECTQDVFVQAWRQADRFDPGRGTVAGWLVQIARSRAIEFARRASRHAIPHEVVEPADQAHDVDGLEEATAVANAMATLPPDQYEVVRLAYFDGLPQTEIAARLEIPLGTVKGRIRLALDRLRSVAAEYDLTREGP
jgi:RNA polymerase sigma-70 factor (ECF subfamily)